MDTILSLVDIAEKLYSLCQTVQDNKEQCGRLGVLVSSLKEVLESVGRQEPSRQALDLDARLAELRACFKDAEALVTKYRSSGRLGRVFKAKAMEDDFQGVFTRLDNLHHLLSLSLQVEQRGKVQAVHNTVDRSEQKIDSLHEKMDKLFQEKEKQGPGTPSPDLSIRDADKLLSAVRSRFVEKASLSLIKQLLDDLQEDRVLNSEEAESVLEEQTARADRARCLIDSVRKKGLKASEKMITHVRERDPTLSETLGLV